VIPVLSRAEARALDRAASERGGVPSWELMENAGRGAAEAILVEHSTAKRFTVLAGRGNNGGDGYVVARYLAAAGRRVRVFATADPAAATGDAGTNLERLRSGGGTVESLAEGSLGVLEEALGTTDLVVDALYGIGLTRELQGLDRAVVECLNASSVPVVALDLPSGLDADRGVPLGVAVHARTTLTFAHDKRGLCTPVGSHHAGRVRVIDIGIPSELSRQTPFGSGMLEASDAASAFVARTSLSHKGSSGRVLVVAGSPGKVGAALLVAHAALRTGAGLVTIATHPDAAAAVEARVLEAMTVRVDRADPESSLAELLEHADAVVVGPGLGFDAVATRLVSHLTSRFEGKVVVDADALAAFSGKAHELARSPGRLVLTPHPGEMARLLGSSVADVEEDRFGAVARAVELTKATVLLKGAPTLIGAPGEPIAVCPTGHPVLATGGSGDVLSGCVGALLVGSDPFRAACAAAFVHGRAAAGLALRRGVDRGVLAHEIADEVPVTIAGLSSEGPFVSR
jgi:ADP-dependent NAD(P)H-hydrate dehydratase / NAD(P)H-hydrate epimerase